MWKRFSAFLISPPVSVLGQGHLALPTRIRGNEGSVDRRVLRADQPGRSAAPNGVLEQEPEHPGLAETAVPVLAERRVMRNRRPGRETTEPAIGKVVAHFLAQAALGRDGIGATDQGHPDQEFGINWRGSKWAVHGLHRKWPEPRQPRDSTFRV